MTGMPKYRYSLINAVTGTLILTYAPMEWQDNEAVWERSTVYWGVFRSFSTSEQSFIKDGCDFLKEIYEREGTEGLCAYQVEIADYTTYEYIITYSGIVDFSTYQYTHGSSGTFVKVQIIDNDFLNSIKTRESTAVNLAKLTDINGSAITPFTTEGISVVIPSRVDTYNVTFGGASDGVGAFPLNFLTREDEAIVVVTNITDMTSDSAAFFKPTYATDLSIHLILTGSVEIATSGNSVVISFKRYDKDGILQATVAVQTQYASSSPDTLTFAIDGIFDITGCADGDYVVLDMTYSESPISLIFDCVNSTGTYTHIIYPDSTVKSYPYYEAFTRILQSITSTSAPFYSNLLGRTDSELETYEADGPMSLGSVTSGLLIRGFSLLDPDVNLNVCLKDLFLTLHEIYPLSLGIETIGGVQKARIEPMRYAFNNGVFMTIEGATEITEESANDLTFSSLAFGFSKSEPMYNTIKGRYEYNAAVSYSTPLTRQQNELGQVAPYRADTNAIVGCLIKPSSLFNSGDTSWDNDIFVLKFLREEGSYQAERNENYDILTGFDNPDNAYNLDYHPARDIRRWGSFIRSFVNHYTDKVLSFIASTNNSSVTTKRTDEAFTAAEGVDIDIDVLDVPFCENLYYNFNFVVTNAIIDLMNGVDSDGVPNCYKLIGFRNNTNEDYRYGWLMKLESKKPGNKGIGTMKLLKSFNIPPARGDEYLYNFPALIDARNICPPGWNVPSEAEWSTLLDLTGVDWTLAGGVLKSVSGWDVIAGGINGTDDFGFTAKPNGMRNADGSFASVLEILQLWDIDQTFAIMDYLTAHFAIGGTTPDPNTGLSLRLIKDDNINTGSMQDNDGNTYPTIKIGDQVWMKEDFRGTKYQDGSIVPLIQPDAAWATVGAPINPLTGSTSSSLPSHLSGTTVVMMGQTFTVQDSVLISINIPVDYYNSKVGLPVFNVRCSIYNTVAGLPTTKIIDSDNVTDASGWGSGNTFNFNYLMLSAGKYAFVLSYENIITHNSSNYIKYGIGATSYPYDDGRFIYKFGSGSWGIQDNGSMCQLNFSLDARCVCVETIAINAGTDGDNCGLTDYQLNAAILDSGFTGLWTLPSGAGTISLTNSGNPRSLLSASTYGAYVLRWTVTKPGYSGYAEVTITFHQKPAANAGSDQNIHASLSATLAAVPSIGTGTWTLISGAGTVSFTNLHSATSGVTVAAYGGYRFRWTEANEGCTDYADMTITFYPT